MSKLTNGIWITTTITTTKIIRNKILYGEKLREALQLPKEAQITVIVPFDVQEGEGIVIDTDTPLHLQIQIVTETTNEQIGKDEK